MKYHIKILPDEIYFNICQRGGVLEYEIAIFKQRIEEDTIDSMELIISNGEGELIVSMFDNDNVYRSKSHYVKVNNDLQYVEFEITNYIMVKRLEYYFNEKEIIIKEIKNEENDKENTF